MWFDDELAKVFRVETQSLREWVYRNGIPHIPAFRGILVDVAKAGGRPVTGEEFDRLVNEATASDANKAVAASRVRFLRGLWWSGLRLNEAVRLDWEDDLHLCVDMSGEKPTFRIRSEADKGRKNRRFPMAPEFAEMLLAVPPSERVGRVLTFLSHGKRPLAMDRITRAISGFGTAAGIVVGRDTEGEPVYASAHDLRRSFGTRWAKRVLPPVLKLLMRHSSIATTMTYYVDIDTDEATAALYDAIAKEARPGDKSGDTSPRPKNRRARKSLQ
ncbi:tyrosine-type recombinase/integrase [Planctomyces sp. SH-PL14]|uniref:tyrosine-type recombinase/integrase n=1 Tax=Planctomyces sp. SH-PL14 TaxID=1632864 RepID=UPI0018D33321|nr:site-specific integrase [Planctomyces sp. SH-PL14]